MKVGIAKLHLELFGLFQIIPNHFEREFAEIRKGQKMRDHSNHIELSRLDAVEALLKSLPVNFGSEMHYEQVAVDNAFGRVLARDVIAKTDAPNVLTCSMDSIAVHWSDFACLGEGEIPDTTGWVRGVDWEFANTGVAMPEGFDTAVVVEHVEVSDDEQYVTIDAAPSKQFAGTKPVGAQMKAGDIVVEAGCIITADVAARIAACGHSTVQVVRKPRVAFIPTGDELVVPNLPYSTIAPERFAGYGKVYESNSVVVRGKVEAWGGQFVPFDIVPDEREAIRVAVERACAMADIVVLNAGSSKGSDDWSVEVLEEMGEIICHQTNHGPGHHSSYAIVDGVPIVGISGPSGGASFTLNFYLLPVMKRFLGIDPAPQMIPAKLVGEIPKGRMEKFVNIPANALAGEQRPAEATNPGEMFYSIKFLTLAVSDEGVLEATPVPGHPGSAETQHANAYFMMPAGVGVEPPSVGDIIQVELRDQR